MFLGLFPEVMNVLANYIHNMKEIYKHVGKKIESFKQDERFTGSYVVVPSSHNTHYLESKTLNLIFRKRHT